MAPAAWAATALYRRAGRGVSAVVHVEVPSGISRELPSWMCDASTCGVMSLGSPQLSINALSELRELLSAALDRGFADFVAD